jgi:hypothetical protein
MRTLHGAGIHTLVMTSGQVRTFTDPKPDRVVCAG